jgi:uncharacterized protein (DUF427 family)
MRAVWNSQVVAESDDIVIVEGNAYFPVASLRSEFVEPSSHMSTCLWKGTAHYMSLNVGGTVNKDAVWFYPEPKEAAANIRGRVAFWKGVTVSA